MPNVNFAVLLNRWDVLKTNLLLHQDELPELQASRQQLVTLIEDGLTFAASQAQLNGSLHDVVQQRDDLVVRGKRLAEYIAAGLRHRFGASNPRLGEFGVRPRTRRRRSATPTDPPETPPSGPPPSDS
jgi:hypothetical protein